MTFLSLTRTVDKIEPECVSAVVVDDDQRIGIILFALAHLLPVGGQNQTIHNLKIN